MPMKDRFLSLPLICFGLIWINYSCIPVATVSSPQTLTRQPENTTLSSVWPDTLRHTGRYLTLALDEKNQVVLDFGQGPHRAVDAMGKPWQSDNWIYIVNRMHTLGWQVCQVIRDTYGGGYGGEFDYTTIQSRTAYFLMERKSPEPTSGIR